jgi:hypothetical protein
MARVAAQAKLEAADAVIGVGDQLTYTILNTESALPRRHFHIR